MKIIIQENIHIVPVFVTCNSLSNEEYDVLLFDMGIKGLS